MPLTIKPPRPPSEQPSTAAGIAIETGPDSGAAGSQSQPTSSSNDGSSSPVAPAYSPITPKVQPALPVVGHGNDNNVFDVPPVPPGPEVDSHLLPDVSMDDAIPPSERAPFSHPLTAGKAPIPPSAPSAIPETQYIPPPPSQPFSSDDSADAIALRAAISALQFQKQKAQGDLQTLEALKQHAAREPERFRRELVAGKLKEERPHFGAIRDVLEASAGDEEDDDDEVVLGAQEERELPASRTGIEPGSGSQQGMSPGQQKEQAPFPKIPGPQDIVRMPPVNWEKYHIVGEGLDALHEQQRRWPGSVPGQENRGREHAVAAPYSPFYDTLEAQAQGLRKGSAGAGAGEQAGETKRAGKS